MLANIDDSPSKDYLLAHGLAERDAARGGALRPRLRPQRGEQPRRRPRARGRRWPSCASGCERWMEETDDPLLDGPIEPRAGHRAQPARPALARRPDGGAPDDARLVLQTQADAPAGLLADWAARARDRAATSFRVDGDEPLPGPARVRTSSVALGSGATRRGRRAGVGGARDRVAARGRRRRRARPRHLLRRAGAGGRARRLRAQARAARGRLGHGRHQRRRAPPRRAVAGLARGRLHAAAAGLRAGVATRSACRPSATAATSRCSSIPRSRPRSSRDWASNDHGDLDARRASRARRSTRPPRATRDAPRAPPRSLFDGFAARAGLVAVASRV